MKRREDLLRDILFLIEKSQRKGSRRLNADKNILYWEIGRLIKQDLYSKETTLTWTHFLKLFLIDNKLHRDDYAKACKEEGWSSSVLHGKIMKLII